MIDYYLGVDPGKSGAFALLDRWGEVVSVSRLSGTMHDVATWLDTYAVQVRFACLEKVHAMPKQGVSSTFKFGTSFGFCHGLLTAHGIPYELVTPQKWQKYMQCRTGGDKKITKARAQQLWPGFKVIHANADALLIAEYTRRIRVGA